MSLGAHKDRLVAHLAGDGIEIGAFKNPMPVGPDARVTYVDLFENAESDQLFPEHVATGELVVPDVIASAEDLSVLEDRSQDFVIASHLMEHLSDPIAALREWHRVLADDGLLMLVLPDKRHTFDTNRRRTTLRHLIEDHEADETARKERDAVHFAEWSRWVNGLDRPDQIEFWSRMLERVGYPIHYHCWILEDIRELFAWLAEEGRVPFALVDEAEVEGCFEFASLWRKSG